jgi:hypothetical protein
VIVKKINKLKEREHRLTFYKDTSLMLAMFFLPFGYDALFKLIMDLSGSYWVADSIFYSISGCFWLSYFLLSRYLNKSNKIIVSLNEKIEWKTSKTVMEKKEPSNEFPTTKLD